MKILSSLDDDIKPVNEPLKVEKQLKVNYVLLENFDGELSSFTGIQSKYLYIPRLHPITSEPENPRVNIISNEPFHIDPFKIRIALGIYGKSWIKYTSFIPIEIDE